MKYVVEVFVLKEVVVESAKDQKQAENIAKYRASKIQYGENHWKVKSVKEL